MSNKKSNTTKKQTRDSKAIKIKIPGEKIVNAALLPAAEEFGKEVRPAGKALGKLVCTGVALLDKTLASLPNAAAYSKRKFAWARKLMEAKIGSIPSDDLREPDAFIIGPAVEALRHYKNEERIANLFANLIASSMDKRTSSLAHPAFTEIITQIAPDEAKILKNFQIWISYPVIDISAKLDDGGAQYFVTNVSDIAERSNCDRPEFTQSYIDNLCRLHLLAKGGRCLDKSRHTELESYRAVKKSLQYLKNKGREPAISHTAVRITDLGRHFLNTCLIDKETETATLDSDQLILNPYI